MGCRVGSNAELNSEILTRKPQTGFRMMTKTTFSCGKELHVNHVLNLHRRLQKSLQKSRFIELKANLVEKVDSAGLQLLVALAQEIERSGGKLVCQKPSEILIDAISISGLSASLGFIQAPGSGENK